MQQKNKQLKLLNNQRSTVIRKSLKKKEELGVFRRVWAKPLTDTNKARPLSMFTLISNYVFFMLFVLSCKEDIIVITNKR